MFNQLKEYKIKHGDCLVPSRYEENFKLGKWVETQRYEYTKLQRASTPSGDGDESKPGANPRLTAERRHRLEAIGFEWKVKHKMKKYYDRQWDTMFEKLLQFKKVSTAHKTIVCLRTLVSFPFYGPGERPLSRSQALPS